MGNSLIQIAEHLPSVDVTRAANYAMQDKSPATRRAYAGDWRAFETFCAARGVTSLPASSDTVAAFLAAQADAGLAASTIGRRGAAIRYAHKLAGHEPPTNAEAVKATLRGIRRTIGTAAKRKDPAVAELTRPGLRYVVVAVPDVPAAGRRAGADAGAANSSVIEGFWPPQSAPLPAYRAKRPNATLTAESDGEITYSRA